MYKSEVLTNTPSPNTLLGLHLDWNEVAKKFQPRFNYYVGFGWLEINKSVIEVKPKTDNIDYLKIFLDCLANPKVSSHLKDSYKIFFDEPLIEIESSSFEITPLLIIHFLSVLKRISQKGLKKGYISTTENLSGKIKGKIKVQQTIRKNLSANRADKNICQYQIHTQNCLENQILKTALNQVSRYIYRFHKTDDDFLKLLKYNQVSFETVSEIGVNLQDFKRIKHSSFYTEYKEALSLAEMIFKRLGFSPNQNNERLKSKTPPFYINMPELFERYVETKLRKKHHDLLAGYGNEGYSETRSTWKLRPDFLLPSLNLIIDAKYKFWYDEEKGDKLKPDYQQLSLYARTTDILNKMVSKDSIPRLIFIYPIDEQNKEINLYNLGDPETGFENIYKIGIQLPIK